jgi:hypothetical protein
MRELALSTLQVGEVVQVLAGDGEDTNDYRFTVLEKGEHPICDFMQRPPGEDAYLGPARVCLEGCVEIDVPEGQTLVDLLDEDTPPDIPPGDGELRYGGIIAIFDFRENTPPKPKIRHVVLPRISGLFVHR